MSEIETGAPTGGAESAEGSGSDARAFLESIQSETYSARTEAREAREALSKQQEELARIKKAFTGDERDEPKGTGQEWYDEFLDAMLEAEKAGKQMPLTARLGTVLAQTQKDALELKKLVAQQQETIKRLQNPNMNADARAYAHMDDAITTTLESMYGSVPAAFHDAVSSEVETILRQIQQEAPDKWQQIRRSETFQKNLVMHCAQKLVPPKAREFLLQKHEEDRPTTQQDFKQAWAEISELEHLARQGKLSEKQIKAMQADKVALRQKELEFRYNGPRKFNQPDTGRRLAR